MKYLIALVLALHCLPSMSMVLTKDKYCPLGQQRVVLSEWYRTSTGPWIKHSYWICQT